MPVTMGLIKRTIVYFTTALTTVGQTTYTVPAGVFSLTVKAWGAGGGGADPLTVTEAVAGPVVLPRRPLQSRPERHSPSI